jgi:hypothetical protein
MATNALIVGACPKLVCGALVTVLHLKVCVCLVVIVILSGRTVIRMSGHIIAVRIAACVIDDCDRIILQRAKILNSQDKLSEHQFIW